MEHFFINFILPFLSILIQTIVNSFLTITISKKLSKLTFSRKQIIIHTVITAFSLTVSTILTTLLPGFNTLVMILLIFLSIKFVLKVKSLKSLFTVILMIPFMFLTELLAAGIFIFITQKDATYLLNSPILKFSVILTQNFILFILLSFYNIFVLKTKKLDKILEYLSSKQLKIFIMAVVIYILPQLFIFILTKYSYPIYFLLLNVVQFILTGTFLLIYLKKDIEHDKAQSDLLISEMHNKTLGEMVDGIRSLKHDYNNIIQTLNGYLATKKYDVLNNYIEDLSKECNIINNLSMIDPKIFNEPGIYGIVGSKYFIAMEKNITFNFNIACDLNDINFPKPELTRILGILIDNAIEATEQTEKKYINLEIIFDDKKYADIIKISNTYDEAKSIDTNLIFEKGFSTKEVRSGIGLWEVKKLISKNSNSQIITTIENNKFIQTIIIEK